MEIFGEGMLLSRNFLVQIIFAEIFRELFLGIELLVDELIGIRVEFTSDVGEGSFEWEGLHKSEDSLSEGDNVGVFDFVFAC